MDQRHRSPLSSFLEVSRFHIIVIAALASLTFGWLFSGRHHLGVPLVVALDWFLVNLLNRVVDLAEDRINGVAGTGFVDRHARALTAACWILLLGSFPLLEWLLPGLLVWRAVFQLIGIAYNYKIIPTLKGFTRFKELYFFKNVSSGVLFLLSGIFYPQAAMGLLGQIPAPRVALLCLFFLAMDLTYEIFYDLRDLPGDKAVGVPTFPVVHGEQGARRLIIFLLVLAASSLVVGYAAGILPFPELLMVAAVIQQALFYRIKVPGGLTQKDCVFVTWLGAGQLLSFNLWVAAGLPVTVFGW